MHTASRMPMRVLYAILLGWHFCSASYATASGDRQNYYLQRADVQDFIRGMVDRHDFAGQELENWFARIPPRPDIIAAISNPAEAKPWYQYRPIFITQSRIEGGVQYWLNHRELLEEAERSSGVPAQIIVAIMGVETRYATHKGRHPVMESLATLAFDYPKRSAFFRSELEHYLLLTREERVDPLSLKGSYAGAMGGPQFISSSFRRYAVDFDGDGKRDIWENPADMIGSIANYFRVHGWIAGEPVAYPAEIRGENFRDVLDQGLKPKFTLAELAQRGIHTRSPVADDRQAALIEFEQETGRDYWLGLQNFYVITRYNHSAMYAMAVFQLSEAIRERMPPATDNGDPD